MQGINRLGKAPPKPGTLRPPDPNKYRTVDMFSEGAEGDADYMRMVQDVSAAVVHSLYDTLLFIWLASATQLSYLWRSHSLLG